MYNSKPFYKHILSHFWLYSGNKNDWYIAYNATAPAVFTKSEESPYWDRNGLSASIIVSNPSGNTLKLTFYLYLFIFQTHNAKKVINFRYLTVKFDALTSMNVTQLMMVFSAVSCAHRSHLSNASIRQGVTPMKVSILDQLT